MNPTSPAFNLLQGAHVLIGGRFDDVILGANADLCSMDLSSFFVLDRALDSAELAAVTAVVSGFRLDKIQLRASSVPASHSGHSATAMALALGVGIGGASAATLGAGLAIYLTLRRRRSKPVSTLPLSGPASSKTSAPGSKDTGGTASDPVDPRDVTFSKLAPARLNERRTGSGCGPDSTPSVSDSAGGGARSSNGTAATMADTFPPIEDEDLYLARGYFARVYMTKMNGRLVAIKTFDISRELLVTSTFSKEFMLLNALTRSNPYVTPLVGHTMDLARRTASLVMELCEACSVNDFLYPSLHLVVPKAEQATEFYIDYAEAAWRAVDEHFNALSQTRGYAFDKFTMFKLDGTVLQADAREGRSLLKQAVVGSRLAALSTQWASVEPPYLTAPVLVLSIGPLVYSFPLPSTDLSNLTSWTERAVDTLPTLTWRERLRMAVQLFRGLANLHNVDRYHEPGRPLIVHRYGS